MDDRSDYNCCSYKTLFDDGVCPNVSCALNKKIEGCYNCTLLDSCEIGFYKKTNDGSFSAKACAMFVRKYDKKCFIKTLDKMHQECEFIKMQELIGNNPNDGLKMLEKYMIKDEEK